MGLSKACKGFVTCVETFAETFAPAVDIFSQATIECGGETGGAGERRRLRETGRRSNFTTRFDAQDGSSDFTTR